MRLYVAWPGSNGLRKEFYVSFGDLVGHDLLGVFRCVYELDLLGDSQRYTLAH